MVVMVAIMMRTHDCRIYGGCLSVTAVNHCHHVIPQVMSLTGDSHYGGRGGQVLDGFV